MELTERQAAFEREVLVHLDVLYRVALRLSGSAADADDLVQETMLRAFRSWHQYQPGTNARAWLLTILRNQFINEYRRRRRHAQATEEIASDPHAVFLSVRDLDPTGAFFDRIVDDRVLAAIDALPDEFREAVILVDSEGLSYEEAAQVLEVPIGTLKSRLFRARRRLQRQLYDYAVEMGYIRASTS